MTAMTVNVCLRCCYVTGQVMFTITHSLSIVKGVCINQSL